MSQKPTFIPTQAALAGKPFDEITVADEYLHGAPADGHYAATETSYYSFNIPEERLNGEIYVWLHPVLKLMSASIYIWTGNRASTLACEYVNHFHYLPYPSGDLAEYSIDEIGLRVKVIEPLRRIQIGHSDSDREVSLELTLEAIMPPAGRPGGFHFTQAMKTAGWLNLQGKKYEIDGYASRDRSWGQARLETARKGPPLDWNVGVFSQDFAFHVLCYEDPMRSPPWVARYGGDESSMPLIWGYVFRDSETVPVRTCSALVSRESDGITPRLVEMTLETVDGKTFDIRGYVNARMPWQTWQNMNVHFCQMRWECEGLIGWGDLQDIQNNDFVHHHART